MMLDQQQPSPSQWRHLPRFFASVETFKEGKSFELEKRTFQHAIQVRRLKVGYFFILFDGSGSEYLAQIESIGRHEATACWIGEQAISRESTTEVTLVVALIASDKMDLIIQKAVELGAKAIQPIITQHGFQLTSHKWPEKQRHWEEIVVSACEQCARNVLSAIHPLQPFHDWAALQHDSINWLLSPHAGQSLKDVLQTQPAPNTPIQILIGPEGGLSADEETFLCKRNWHRVGLGPRILRAETAAIAALSQIL